MDSIDLVRLHFSETNLFFLNLSLGFIMLGVAINLKVSDFLLVLKHPKAVVAGVLAQFVILPALTYLLIVLLNPTPSFALGMMLVAACPGGNISNFMSATAKGNAALSVSLTAVSSTLCILMTPLNLAMWASFYAPTALILQEVSLDLLDMFGTITTILIIPTLLGMLLRRYKPLIADELHPFMHYGSIFIFAVIVFLAFSANFDHFLTYIHYIVLLVCVHNGVALLAGYQVATLFGLSKSDRRSITIETGIQNSGLGLILIFSFFDGMGGMALIAAWWGIWHIFSGLGLSFFWRRK